MTKETRKKQEHLYRAYHYNGLEISSVFEDELSNKKEVRDAIEKMGFNPSNWDIYRIE